MDATEFERRARATTSREELETLKANALAKGNHEFAKIATEVLLEHFPHKSKRGGGPTPTTATFQGTPEHFPNGKEAYIWLVERFRIHRPGLLESQVDWHQRMFKSHSRKYFARTSTDLFPEGSDLPHKPGNVSALTGGWYANVNTDHPLKFDILLRLAAVCGLEFPADWNFEVTGATVSLVERQKTEARAQRILREIGW